MAGAVPKDSVWSAMNYTPPRGKCNYKASLMSPACPCMRFMLHPINAARSFDCDGCAHHASFHLLENAAEDAVLKRWAEEQTGTAKERQAIGCASSKKRKLITEKPNNDEGDDLGVIDESGMPRTMGLTNTKGSRGTKERH